MAIHLVRNAFQLIDVTGKATTWGRWDPSTLNGNRNFSDGRGVNSVQMLAFLASANRTAARLGESQAVELLTDGYQHLVGPAAGYLANALNAKIVAPCDDNFSDDELLMLPTYTHLVGAAAGGGASAKEEVETLRAGLRRSFDVALDKERSALWGSIFLAAGGARSAAEHKAVMSDVLWSLRNCACQGPPSTLLYLTPSLPGLVTALNTPPLFCTAWRTNAETHRDALHTARRAARHARLARGQLAQARRQTSSGRRPLRKGGRPQRARAASQRAAAVPLECRSL